MEFLMEYHLAGIVIGVATFLIIGIFHPLVTKGEYYFGVRIWWIFLLMGIAAVIIVILQAKKKEHPQTLPHESIH